MEQHALKVGEPGYGVPAEQLTPATKSEVDDRPPLRNKPDPREFLDPKRFARPPLRSPETRSDRAAPVIVTRKGKLK